MNDIQPRIKTIVQQLDSMSRPVAALLQPGLEANRVTDLLHSEGLSVNAEIVQFYDLYNGTRITADAKIDDLCIMPGFYFLSLEDALENYAAFKHDDRWNMNWLPILANGGGDFYVADFGGGIDTCLVRHFRIDESEHPIEFESLNDLLSTLQAAFEERIFFVDQDSSLEMDDNAFAELAARLNPEVAWWHD